MSSRGPAGRYLLLPLVCCAVSLAQQKPVVPGAQEFPVMMRQNVVAGKTPVGTKVEASLTMATLLNGKVFPQGAVFSGVVIESTAKSASMPSRLSVRMDSLHWGKITATIKTYVTSWYYPVRIEPKDDQSDGAMPNVPSSHRRWVGGPYSPSPPDGTAGRGQYDSSGGSGSVSTAAEHRVAMKNVESVRDTDATVALTSSRANIKLDKSTVYVLSGGDPAQETRAASSKQAK